MRHTGKLKSWNTAKGFGFVEPKYGGKDIFVHISSFLDRSNMPEAGQSVTFSLSTDNKGRACGTEIGRHSDTHARSKSHFYGNLTVALAILFTVAVSFSGLTQRIPMAILWYYLAINCFSFTLYFSDKAAAKKGEWRTKEDTLHLVALMGGWPGAAFAQQIFRHKSKKFGFRLVYWLTLFLNIAGYLWLHTKEGQLVLKSTIASFS